MKEANDIPTKRRIDGITALMVVVTAASLLGAAWLRTQRLPTNTPPAVGTLAPPLRLLDIETSESVVLLGLRGKVTWVVFWSAQSPAARSSLVAIEEAWNTLKGRGRFTMVVAAIETDHCDRVRAAVADSGVKLPIFLATAETRRRFGAREADPPLNVLLDADGQIAMVSRGTSPQAMERITDQARRMLDELGPIDNTRFASLIAVPRTDTFPSLGSSRPANRRSKVVLPAPSGPTMPVTSPGAMLARSDRSPAARGHGTAW